MKPMSHDLRQRAEYTYKHNLKHGRHGWLRLTPAYSVKVVDELIDSCDAGVRVLDPFVVLPLPLSVRLIMGMQPLRLTSTHSWFGLVWLRRRTIRLPQFGRLGRRSPMFLLNSALLSRGLSRPFITSNVGGAKQLYSSFRLSRLVLLLLRLRGPQNARCCLSRSVARRLLSQMRLSTTSRCLSRLARN